jgi:hypothetical protein
MKFWQVALRVALQVALTAILIGAAPLVRAETIDVGGDHGGFVYSYQQKWERLAAQKVNIRIVGICASACTLLTGYFPRKDICVTPDAVLGFHAGTFPFVTDTLLRIYPEDIRKWIDAHGGLTFNLIWLQRPEIYKFFRKC